MTHANILVVGGSGFVGRHLVAALAARGAKVTVPTRSRERAKHLILLPTVDVVQIERLDACVLSQLAVGHDTVVNLAGILNGPDFAATHVDLAQAVVNACRSAGAHHKPPRLLHMSAVGADPQAPSEYLRSKGFGERAVLAADDLEVTVFRPSIIFGPEDRFLNMFARLAALFPVLPVGSPDARFQPVYVGDVVRAFLAALDDREAAGKRYDLCGPKEYSLRQLVELVCAVTGRRRLVVGLPDSLSYLQALVFEKLPGQLVTRDNYYSLRVPSVCRSCNGGAFPFGIHPVLLEAVAPSWLAPTGPRERYPRLRWKAKR